MAFSNLQELVDRTIDLVQNERAGVGLDRSIVEAECLAAITWLSRYSPRAVTASLSGDGSSYSFALSLLSASDSTKAWVAGFSTVTGVEHPTGEQRRAMLQADDYELYPNMGAATHLRFGDTVPSSGSSNILVEFTVPHTVSATASTVPDHLEPAFEYASAANVCRVYAARYGHTTSASLDADSVDYGSKSDTWGGLAKAFADRAGRILGVDLAESPQGAAGTVKATGGYIDFDPDTRFGGLLRRARRNR